MAPFRPYRDRPEFSMSYFQVPVDVLEDATQLVEWARAAVHAAIDSPARSAARPRTVKRAKRSVHPARRGIRR